MKMKKYFVLMLVVLTGIVSSCKYDDDELWDNVNDLAQRISALETLTNQMNGDISAMKTIISALENQVAVSEVEKLTDGYILHFTDGTKATIKNGKDGADGTDGTDGKDGVDGVNGKDGADGANAPIINVKQDNGIYYWTITVDGETTWLTDDAGNKLPVNGTNGKDGADGEDGKDGADGEDGKDGADGTPGTPGADGENGKDGADGKDGIVPQLKVDAEGYWTVSYDNGVTFDYVLNSEGKKVYAIGEKGDKGNTGSSGSSGSSGSTGSTGATGPQGPQGSKGPKGDTKFQSVTVSGNVVIITMTDTYNNEEFRFPLASSVLYYTSSTTQDNTTLISTSDVIGLSVNETKALYYALSQWDANSISVEVAKKPEGIEIDIDESKKEITVKAESSVSDGKVILFFYTENQTITSVLNFAFAATAATVADVNTILANNSNVDNLIVNIDGNIGSGDEILLPQATDGTIRTFVFAGTSSSITIKDDTNTGNFAGQVIIEVPEGIVLPSITANIPDGEVYIKQGEVTTLVTTASSYTTIIGANAKVSSITVNKGNVRFEKGIKEYPTVTRGTENSEEVFVIYEDGVPKSVTDENGIHHIDIPEFEFRRAAAEGGKIVLDQNVTIKNTITVAKDKEFTINLNGYTLKGIADDIMFRVDGIMTINGGTLGSKMVSEEFYLASVNTGGTVNVNGGSYKAVITCFQANGGTLNITDGTFQVEKTDTYNTTRYLLNHIDSQKNSGMINVTGGTFVDYDPSSSMSENPAMNFVAEGYTVYPSSANEWIVIKSPRVSEGKYELSNVAHMLWFADQVNNRKKNFNGEEVKLTTDIDLEGINWTPIGSGETPFEGTFDGDGYQVKNLTVDLIAPAARNLSRSTNNMKGAGLFGVVKNAIFKNVTIPAAKINGSISENEKAHGAGALVGCALGKITIEAVKVTKDNVTNEKTSVEGSQNVGSIVGYVSGNSVEVKSCEVSGTTLSAQTAETETPSADTSNSAGGVVGQVNVTHEYAEEGEEQEVSIVVQKCTVENITLDATSEETSVVGGVVGSLTAAENVSVTTESLTVSGNSVTDATIVVPEVNEDEEVTGVVQGSVVGDLSSLNGDISESIKQEIAQENQNAGELVIEEKGKEGGVSLPSWGKENWGNN